VQGASITPAISFGKGEKEEGNVVAFGVRINYGF
jgi:hypothetical protein